MIMTHNLMALAVVQVVQVVLARKRLFLHSFVLVITSTLVSCHVNINILFFPTFFFFFLFVIFSFSFSFVLRLSPSS